VVSRRGGRSFGLGAFIAGGLATTALAHQEVPEAALPVPVTEAASEAPSGSASPASDSPDAPQGGFRWRRVELSGRVLARGFRESEDGATVSTTDVENARLELRWRPSRWLRGVVEFDLAEDRHWKDVYVGLRSGRFEIRAGQFKPPISPVQMASRWDLPTADRGLLSEVLFFAFGIAGRRPGAQIEWDQKGGAWSAMGGLFRASSVRGDRIGDEAFDNFAKGKDAWKATGRLAYGPKRAEIAMSFDLRPAEPRPGEGMRRFWTTGVDLVFKAKGVGPRVWAEGYLGSSWQDANAFDGDDALFVAGRVIAGWRLGDEKKGGVSAEPFLAGTLFDPDASVQADLLSEVGGGVHVGAFRHFRLTLEAQRGSISRNAPLSLGLFLPGQRGEARTRLLAQLGAAF
jgi:hypothetical protein